MNIITYYNLIKIITWLGIPEQLHVLLDRNRVKILLRIYIGMSQNIF